MAFPGPNSVWDDPVVVERLLAALERIAMALELATGLSRPGEEHVEVIQDGPQPFSSVSYTSDIDELIREERKEAYLQRTGRRLAEEEDVPRPDQGRWPSPEEDEAPPAGSAG